MHRGLVFVAVAIGTSCSTLLNANERLFVSLLEAKQIVQFERNSETGELNRTGQVTCPAEPAIMCTSPDRRWLFVSFRSTGQLASFSIQNPQRPPVLISVAAGGEDPAYLQVDATGRFLLSAYYVANKVCVHAINEDGSLSPQPVQTVPTAARAHGIAIDSHNRRTYVSHTGANCIFQFEFNSDTGRLRLMSPDRFTAPDDFQFRHVAMHANDRWLYSNGEKGDNLSFFTVDQASGQLTLQQTVSTLPEDFPADENSTARCEMTSDGRFIYVANRGHDSIAAFAIDPNSGRLTSLGHVSTEQTPRSFTVDSQSRYLYAAGQDSGQLAIYRLQDDGRLVRTKTLPVGEMPWAVLAVD